jgi:twitching motility protein PilT
VLAALIRQYNQQVAGHLVSIEDPMEYLHRDARSSVTQREVGTDVGSMAEGLRAAGRLAPDAVFAGDVPDAECAELVLRLAEECLVVVAGVASPDGTEAVRAFIRRFPTSRHEEIASRIAGVLKGHVSAPRAGSASWQPVGDEERLELRAARKVA